MKDLPTKLPENLKIGAVIKRDSPMDVIITKNKSSFNFLKSPGTIATGSLRRELQLKLLNKNLKFVDIRGNIETRIKKLMNNNWDGLIMAKAAINRLNLKINYQEFKINEMIPAANQGVIGIEVNDERTDLDDLLKLINDKKTRTISDIESSIIDQLNGGCTTPIGCLVNLNNDEYIINIFLSNKSGTKQIVKQFKFKSKSISDLTGEVVSELYSLGAKEIVKEYTN
jgi:hydroxymethylbilane synthase